MLPHRQVSSVHPRVLCTTDISLCDPVTERKVNTLIRAIIVIACAVVGFPILVRVLHFLISYKFKFCKFAKDTGGISICEFFVRTMCFCCCNFTQP